MPSKKELALILENKSEDEYRFITVMEGDQNPQVREMVIRALERKDVYDGILHYLKTGEKGLI